MDIKNLTKTRSGRIALFVGAIVLLFFCGLISGGGSGSAAPVSNAEERPVLLTATAAAAQGEVQNTQSEATEVVRIGDAPPVDTSKVRLFDLSENPPMRGLGYVSIVSALGEEPPVRLSEGDVVEISGIPFALTHVSLSAFGYSGTEDATLTPNDHIHNPGRIPRALYALVSYPMDQGFPSLYVQFENVEPFYGHNDPSLTTALVHATYKNIAAAGADYNVAVITLNFPAGSSPVVAAGLVTPAPELEIIGWTIEYYE